MTFRFARRPVLLASLLAAAFALAAAGLFALSDRATADEAQLARGEYLATIMDCHGCHTPGSLLGEPDPDRHLGGSDVGFFLPGLGIFYPPNLTPDVETGIGSWSVDEIVTAVRTGERPDGRLLAPIMASASYGALTDEDAVALVTYLKSLPPVSHKVPEPVGGPEDATAPYMTVVFPQ